MAVLNPPRSLPVLGRAIVNYLLDARRNPSEDDLVAAFKPEGLNPAVEAAGGLKNTLSALRAINVLEADAEGALRISPKVDPPKRQFTKAQFRRVLQDRVFDFDRDGDVWATRVGDGHTSGGRDLNRALSWLLAQDALGGPLAWTENVQRMQTDQFKTTNNEAWAITNDTRWLPTVRWILALGLANPSVVKDKNGIVPLPVDAIDDALNGFPNERMTIHDFLARIGRAVPVLHGGAVRSGLVAQLGSDPDPGINAECADSSVGQALRILEERGRVAFETLPDADGIRLSRFDNTRRTHVTVKTGGKK
jgi:hypothetical protein